MVGVFFGTPGRLRSRQVLESVRRGEAEEADEVLEPGCETPRMETAPSKAEKVEKVEGKRPKEDREWGGDVRSGGRWQEWLLLFWFPFLVGSSAWRALGRKILVRNWLTSARYVVESPEGFH